MEYNRANAVAYAKKWAYGRNPKYYDFSDLGGDCTNFASQCIYCLLYTSPSPRDSTSSRMPSSA